MRESGLRLLWPLMLAVACDAAAVRQSPFGEYAPQINSWLDRQLAKQVADLSVPVAQLDASLGIHGPPASDLPPQRGDELVGVCLGHDLYVKTMVKAQADNPEQK